MSCAILSVSAAPFTKTFQAKKEMNMQGQNGMHKAALIALSKGGGQCHR